MYLAVAYVAYLAVLAVPALLAYLTDWFPIFEVVIALLKFVFS